MSVSEWISEPRRKRGVATSCPTSRRQEFVNTYACLVYTEVDRLLSQLLSDLLNLNHSNEHTPNGTAILSQASLQLQTEFASPVRGVRLCASVRHEFGNFGWRRPSQVPSPRVAYHPYAQTSALKSLKLGVDDFPGFQCGCRVVNRR